MRPTSVGNAICRRARYPNLPWPPRHACRIPPSSRASISVSGIRCPDDLRERAYGTPSGISCRHHRERRRPAPAIHTAPPLPAPRGAMRRGDRADAISGRRGGMDGIRRCGGAGRRSYGGAICAGMRDQLVRTWQTETTSQARCYVGKGAFPDDVTGSEKSAQVAGNRNER